MINDDYGSCSCCEMYLHGGNENRCNECGDSMCDDNCTYQNRDGDDVCSVCFTHDISPEIDADIIAEAREAMGLKEL